MFELQLHSISCLNTMSISFCAIYCTLSATNKQSAKSPTIALLATIENVKTCLSLPNYRWQLIKRAKPLLLYMKVVCAHNIGTDHLLFNVAGVVIIFYIVLITIEPV